MSPKVVSAAIAVNKEIADFREQCVALIGMVDEMRIQVAKAVPSREHAEPRRPAKKLMR